MQSQLRCCAVDDNGWTAYRGSWWDLSVNAYFYNVSTSSFYKRVPESCCLTLIDPLTGYPTGEFKSIEQCQSWQYGPPRFSTGAHNDAVYYRCAIDSNPCMCRFTYAAIQRYTQKQKKAV
ncbi:hypothetical protein ACTXT7_009931 [Hymenolepis weldensis]